MTTNAIFREEASKGNDCQEENEEIQRRDQGSRSPTYDEANHSNELENDRGSR
jgi:hypothetical protein